MALTMVGKEKYGGCWIDVSVYMCCLVFQDLRMPMLRALKCLCWIGSCGGMLMMHLESNEEM